MNLIKWLLGIKPDTRTETQKRKDREKRESLIRTNENIKKKLDLINSIKRFSDN